MRYAMPIAYLLFSIFGFVAASGDHFYGGGPGRTATKNPVPKWFGRLWFIVFSVAAAYMGLKGLWAIHHH